jgi:invasion protein IalB
MKMHKLFLAGVLIVSGLLGMLWLSGFGYTTTAEAAAPANAPAVPAETDIADYKDWRFSCVAVGKEAKKECRIFQQIVWDKDKGREKSLKILFFAANGQTPAKDKKDGKPVVALMRVIVPLGIELRPGLAMMVGKGSKQLSIPYDVCTQMGCIANVAVAADIVDKIKGADGVMLGFRAPGAKPSVLKVSTSGFGAAFDSLQKAGRANKG